MNAALVPGLILLAVLLIGTVVLGVLVYTVYRSKRRAALVADTPLSDVADLDEGLSKVVGRAVALEEPLVSPLSQTECVFFHFKVEEQRTRTVRTGSRNSNIPGSVGTTRTETYWVAVVNDRQAIDCGVDDRTGRARVDLLAAETVLDSSAHKESGVFNSCPPRLQRTLSRHYGYSTTGLLFNKTLRYTETVIREGDRLVVVGDVEFHRGEPEFYKGANPLLVSDRGEKRLVRHYQQRVLWCYLGIAATAVLTPLAAAVPVYMLVRPAAAPRQPPAMAFAPAGNGAPAFGAPPGADLPANWPVQQDAISGALADLRSPDPLTQARGAAVLATRPTEPARREEVLRVLRPLADHENLHLRVIARRAIDHWDPTARQASRPVFEPAAPPRNNPPAPAAAPARPVQDEDGYYKQSPTQELPEVAVPWTAKPDPATAAVAAPQNPRGMIPLSFLYSRAVVFPALASPFVAVNPKRPRGQPDIDGLSQVYDLRTMRPVSGPFMARVALGERAVLSPDGAYAAGRVSGLPSNVVVEVVSTKTGQSAHRLEAGHGKEFAFPVEFVGPDRLLTCTQETQFPDPASKAEYRVWDVKTGKILSHFAYDLVYHRKWCGLSAGGRYLVLQRSATIIGYRLVIFDLTTGKVAGDVQFQPRGSPFGQAAGIAFSPDGKEFAMLWRLGKKPDLWAKVLVFDAATGKQRAEHRLGYAIASLDSLWGDGGPACIQWVPDNSGWLICGHLLVNRTSGAITGRVGAEPKWQGQMPPRRFVGRSYLTTILDKFDKALMLEPLPGGTGFE